MTASEPPSAFTVTEVDGVRTVWSPLPGPLTAGLLVRVGSADETLVSAGTTHLLEHLALFGLGRPGDHSNAFVDQTVTMFHCTGEESTVTEFFAGLCRQLVNPPIERLADEREVLRAEYAQRGTSAEGRLLAWRYGAVSYGVSAASGIGLDGVTPERLVAWSHRYATRGNVALWLTGPPPAGLQLNLPDGEPIPPPDPWRTVLPQLPAFLTGPDDGVAVHAVLERGYANQALAELLQGRLIDELRTRRAVAYSPQADYRPLTADVARLLLLSDLVPGRQSDGVRAFLAVLHEFAEGAVSEDDVARWRADAVRALTDDRDRGAGRLPGLAWQLLYDRPLDSRDEVVAQLEAVRTEEIVARAGAVLSAALALIPRGVRVVRDPWVSAPATVLEPVAGVSYQHLEAAQDAPERLVAGDAGITWHGGAGRHVTVTRDTAVAIQVWPDGRRAIHGADANVVVVEPTLWESGRQIVEQVDRLWPAELVIPMPQRPIGDIPTPRPRPEPVVSTATPAAKATSRSTAMAVLVMAVIIAGGFVVAAVANGHGAPLLPAAVMIGAAYRSWKRTQS